MTSKRNPFERASRLEKAAKLEQALRLAHFTAGHAALMEPSDWHMVASLVGVQDPSPETCAAVIASMQRAEQWERINAAPTGTIEPVSITTGRRKIPRLPDRLFSGPF